MAQLERVRSARLERVDVVARVYMCNEIHTGVPMTPVPAVSGLPLKSRASEAQAIPSEPGTFKSHEKQTPPVSSSSAGPQSDALWARYDTYRWPPPQTRTCRLLSLSKGSTAWVCRYSAWNGYLRQSGEVSRGPARIHIGSGSPFSKSHPNNIGHQSHLPSECGCD